MDNNEEKRSNLNPDEKSAENDIPLWLQGLEDPNKSDIEPTESSEKKEDSWIKEVENPPTNIDGLPSDQYIDDDQEFEIQKQSSETSQDINNTNEVNTNTMDYQFKNSEEQISNEGFIDFSDSNLGGNMEFGPSNPDDNLLSEDELPQWLMDMIDEPNGDDVPDEIEDPMEQLEETDATMKDFEKIDEPSENLEFSESPPASESLEITQEIPVSEYMDDEETVSFLVNEIETEDINQNSEEISKPQDEEFYGAVLTNIEDQTWVEEPFIEKSIPETSEITTDENLEPLIDEMPKTLKFAKKLIDSGEFESALDIIQSHLEKTSYLEDVEKWLSTYFDEHEEVSYERLEVLGDALRKRGKLIRAFSAYTQAVEVFLSNKPENYEIN